jgi:hypothetical protein
MASGQYSVPAEHVVLLTKGAARNLGPISRTVDQLGEQIPTLVERFRDGEGISYEAYRPYFDPRK